MVRLQGEGGPIGFPSPWSRTTRPSAIRTRRAPRAWPPARTPQSRARLARAPVPHCGETITMAFLGFLNHAAPGRRKRKLQGRRSPRRKREMPQSARGARQLVSPSGRDTRRPPLKMTCFTRLGGLTLWAVLFLAASSGKSISSSQFSVLHYYCVSGRKSLVMAISDGNIIMVMPPYQ